MDEKITAILYNVASLHELVRKKEGLPPLGLYGSGKGKRNSSDGNGKGKGNGNSSNGKGKGNGNGGNGGMFDNFDIHFGLF
uniref:Uncharacterized protein n=1 Tax=Fagus sylvatica TaxID=28930 RepID=A0A2N9FTX3_FAGSY